MKHGATAEFSSVDGPIFCGLLPGGASVGDNLAEKVSFTMEVQQKVPRIMFKGCIYLIEEEVYVCP
jgi:hypothetical protein